MACRDFEQAYALKAEAHSIFTTAILVGLMDGDDCYLKCLAIEHLKCLAIELKGSDRCLSKRLRTWFSDRYFVLLYSLIMIGRDRFPNLDSLLRSMNGNLCSKNHV